jgi:gliding motility-associated lipoprotein GldD
MLFFCQKWFKKNYLSVIIIFVIVVSVKIYNTFYSIDYLPKPYGYARIELPTQEYLSLPNKYPYNFEISKHAILVDESVHEYGPYCITIKYPCFDAIVQITYKNFHGDRKKLRILIVAAKSLTYKHQVKAYNISDRIIEKKDGTLFCVSELYGEIPTPIQFYGTDIKNHFIRGAVYLQTSTDNDYLEPVINFLKADVIHLIDSLVWKEKI